MMTFDTFMLNLIGSAELIASPTDLRRKWVQRESGITSAFDYDELAVQLLDDLDLEGQTNRFRGELKQIEAFDAVLAFTDALLAVDNSIPGKYKQCDHAQLLVSGEWSALQRAAHMLIMLPAVSQWRECKSQEG